MQEQDLGRTRYMIFCQENSKIYARVSVGVADLLLHLNAVTCCYDHVPCQDAEPNLVYREQIIFVA